MDGPTLRVAPSLHKKADWSFTYPCQPWKGEHVLDCLRNALPGRTGIPRLVVLDNASCHRSRTVRQARWELAKQGIWLWYLPAPARN